MLNNQEIKMPVLIEDLGMQFATEKTKEKKRYGLYKCHCGKEFRAIICSIKSGNTKSCGCHRLIMLSIKCVTHGMRKHKIYQSYTNMIQRCTNINNTKFNNYGGRGIKVCDRWLESFENFRDDMLPTWVDGLTIDRIDVNGNYEPTNCRWATKNVQSRNTRVLRADNKSGYRGVCWHKSSNKWYSQILIHGKHKYLGSFDDSIKAAQSYDNYIILHNLEHTKNFS